MVALNNFDGLQCGKKKPKIIPLSSLIPSSIVVFIVKYEKLHQVYVIHNWQNGKSLTNEQKEEYVAFHKINRSKKNPS